MTTELDSVRAAIKRWRTRAKRAHTMLDKLERKAARLEKKTSIHIDDLHKSDHPIAKANAESWRQIGKTSKPAATGNDIPAFLDRRKKEAEAKDKATAAAIVAEQTERKKAAAKIKREVRAEVRQAKLTGQLKRMPLTGKAALEFIKQG